jgi:MFS family permease
VIETKLNIIDSMEEKYNELIAEGKNENEALGIVISQFGSIDELKKELNIEESEAITEPSGDVIADLVYSSDEKQRLKDEYNSLKKKTPLYFALAVCLYILSPLTIVMTAETLEKGSFWPLVPFFGFIAFATAIFVYFGVRTEHYEKILDIKKKDEDDNPFTGLIFLIAVIIYLFLGFTRNLWHPGWIIFIVAAAINVVINLFLSYRNKN